MQRSSSSCTAAAAEGGGPVAALGMPFLSSLGFERASPREPIESMRPSSVRRQRRDLSTGQSRKGHRRKISTSQEQRSKEPESVDSSSGQPCDACDSSAGANDVGGPYDVGNARRIASLMSRLQYASMDPFAPSVPEVAMGTRARATAYAQPTHQNQSALEIHAARVRNQFELRSEVFLYGHHLAEILKNLGHSLRLGEDQTNYNLLQIIRHRGEREAAIKRGDIHPLKAASGPSRKRVCMWELPLIELIEEISWRKSQIHKARRKLEERDLQSKKQRLLSSVPPYLSGKTSDDQPTPETPAQLRETCSRDDLDYHGHARRQSLQSMQAQFHAHQSKFMSTGSLSPAAASIPCAKGTTASCAELIDLLRSRHSDSLSVGSEIEEKPIESADVRPKFSRATSCRVTKPRNSDAFSFDSVTSLAATTSSGSGSRCGSNPAVPQLTVTSDSGDTFPAKVPKWNSKWDYSMENSQPVTVRRPSVLEDPLDVPAQRFVVEEDEEDPQANFGSLRSKNHNVSDSSERAVGDCKAELEYMLALFRIALRKQDATGPLQVDIEVTAPLCDKLRLQIKNTTVPSYIGFLGEVEKEVLVRQQELDTNLAGALDALRITTDRMCSEVSTTLNRQLRETNSRLERMAMCQDTRCLLRIGYALLEWLLLAVMWVLWLVVKVFVTTRSTINAAGWLFIA